MRQGTKLALTVIQNIIFIHYSSSAQERLDENLKALKAQVELKLSGDTPVASEGEIINYCSGCMIIMPSIHSRNLDINIINMVICKDMPSLWMC